VSTEPWLAGPMDGVPVELQPAAHAFLNALADVEKLAANGLTDAELRARPGGAAPIAFHLVHIAGAIDRLLTYAQGSALNEAQREALKRETDHAAQDSLSVAGTFSTVRDAIESALDTLRATDAGLLQSPREVGRARLPTTLAGLLFHAAEHTARHAGQALTTFNIVRGL
jgi:uncharacterized damage-inducible protein DinB